MRRRRGLKQRIILQRRTDRVIFFEFDVGTPLVHGSLDRHEMGIAVRDDDTTRDLILVLEAFPERIGAEIVCTQCARNERRVFSNREELWRDHLFEPLLQWVNEALAPAVAIAVFEFDGATEAKLVSSPQESANTTKTIAMR
jgi:hypothetical protein